jgi:two-component system, OmpR family, response regulator MtrA
MVRDHQDVHVLVLGQGTLSVTEPASALRDHRVALSVHEDALAALLAFPELAPDAVVVPTALPGIDVTALISAISGAGNRPCFVSWAPEQGSTTTVTACLSAGARGLLPPRITVRELVTALHVAGVVAHEEPVLQVGELTVDLAGLVARHGPQRCQLNPGQAALLEALARAHPHPVSRDELMATLGLTGRPHTLTQAVTRLRRQLRGLRLAWDPVEFVPGGAYRLVGSSPALTETGA